MSLYEEIIVYKRAVDSKSTAYFPARLILLMGGRTDGETDRHGAYREITIKRSCNVLKFNPSKKACGADCMSKIRQNRSETLIVVPGSTVTYSRLNQKYNICAFTQEIQVFEG